MFTFVYDQVVAPEDVPESAMFMRCMFMVGVVI